MKKISFLLCLFCLMSIHGLYGQDQTTVTANSSDISDNLDLEAVASIFGDSKDLEDFEKKLNDPKNKVSNLDLNEDGTVDYLRVVENAKEDYHLVVIQSVIGKDKFQDVATIEVTKDDKDKNSVTVTGDTYIYGDNYIIQPIYPVTPIIFGFFWGAFYRPWYSPWFWGYYPPYFHPWVPYPIGIYHRNVNVHINNSIHFNHHTTVNVNNNHNVHNNIEVKNSGHNDNNINIDRSNDKIKQKEDVYRPVRQSDFQTMHPDRSFSNRNPGISNRSGLSNGGGFRR